MRNILIALLLSLTACDGDDRDAAAPPPPAPTPAAQIAIFGDSIVRFMEEGNPVAPFDKALNAGIGGQTSGQIAGRVTAAAPIIFLEGGINDFVMFNSPDPTWIISNYRRMLDKLTGVRVVVIGIPPVDETLFAVNVARLISNAKIARINAQLVNLCSQYSNCQTATAAMQFNMSGKTLDGIHPKPETYAAWTAVLAQYLE
jgi:lysophospholipase L1-like esterase